MAEQATEKEASPVLYSNREDWKDVKPVEQSDLSQPLVPIFYPPEYQDATDYFRGIVAVGDHSQRVLELTEHIIRMNPAHYSVWQYRYDTLIALQSPLEDELTLMEEFALKNLKFYQVWHHRKLLLIKTKTALKELNFLSRVLSQDSKNYHTWAYRQWLLTHFDDEELWEYELPFVDLLLVQDVRNNSAWHHRFFVLWDSGVREGMEDREGLLRREVGFAKEKIAVAPNNLSAWNYLRGILEKMKRKYGDYDLELEKFSLPYIEERAKVADGEKVEDMEVADEDPDEIIDLDNPQPSKTADLPCSLALEFLADIYLEDTPAKNVQRSKELLESLRDKHDTMRKKYWDYRIKTLPATDTKATATA